MLSVHQRYRQTDGQTDGRTTYDSNTALALRATRGNKTKDKKVKRRSKEDNAKCVEANLQEAKSAAGCKQCLPVDGNGDGSCNEKTGAPVAPSARRSPTRRGEA